MTLEIRFQFGMGHSIVSDHRGQLASLEVSVDEDRMSGVAAPKQRVA